MNWVLAPYRIKYETHRYLDNVRVSHLISDVRKRMIEDAAKIIKARKIANPMIYLLDKREPGLFGGFDLMMAFFIGTGIELTPLLRDEKWVVSEVLKVSTSETGWVKSLKDFIFEKTTGEKVDPKSKNPYH